MATVILVTGAAGFIGAHLCRRLQAEGYKVIGIDWKVSERMPFANVQLRGADIGNAADMAELFKRFKFDTVVNLAAQAGVRHPVAQDYAHSNLAGFVNVLDCCKRYEARLIYASSSSVYGDTWPQVETARTDRPLSLYAATKKANELMAQASGIDAVGLRFFTVYGPYGRPDMIPLLFMRKILAGEPLELYNGGEYRRDFTYIDDAVEGVMRVLRRRLTGIYNIGRGQPVTVNHFVTELESALGVEAQRLFLAPRAGEMPETCADISALAAATGYAPKVDLVDGLREMVTWYRA